MKLPIVTIPNQSLRIKSKLVKKITPELVQLANNLLETAVKDGIGMSAPQVGKNVRLIVTNYQPKKKEDAEDLVPKTILFNPKIMKRSIETDKLTEGCLSVPGVTGVVERAKQITVTGTNELGLKVKIDASDLYARVLQHEVDHLDGVLFTDRLRVFNVVFYGTSEFATPSLEALIKHPQFNVVAVVTETDKQAGRGHVITESPVKKLAISNKIKVFQPQTLRVKHPIQSMANEAKSTVNQIKLLKPDIQVVVSYGKLLTPAVLNLATTINVHPSMLPKYRGATPIATAIQDGEKETGVSIILVTPELDAGPIITMYKYEIGDDETCGELTERLSSGSAKQLILTLETIISDKAEVWEQNNQYATYTEKIETDSAELNWEMNPSTMHNFIRAHTPKPGVWFEDNNKRIKIYKTHLVEGKFVIDQLQIEGKKVCSLLELKNGYPAVFKALNEKVNKVNEE